MDDPSEPGRYDAEWIVVLDDWIDGTGTSPEEVLANLLSARGAGMGNDMSSMGMRGKAPFGDAGDVDYPHYLVYGRAPSDPEVLRARPTACARTRSSSHR